MALFGKKKEEVRTKPGCCCGGTEDAKAEASSCCGEKVEGVCSIKVLGAGCKSCHELYENVKKAVEDLGPDVEVEYITDMEKILSQGVMSTPALVVNDKVVSAGKVLKVDEVKKFLV